MVLVDLGIVARREAGPSALVRLERECEAARVIIAIAQLQTSAMECLRDLTADFTPAPESLIVFGSLVRGGAPARSDLDVLAVRAKGVPADDNDWIDALGAWERVARRIVGNPVNMMVVAANEMPALIRRHSGPWRTIANEGVVLMGKPLNAIALVA